MILRRLADPRSDRAWLHQVEPFEKRLVQPNSLDIRLGNHFLWYEEGEEVIDPYNRETVKARTQETRTDSIVLEPGQFMLAETLEVIDLPDNIVASIEGKSSIARLGIELHQTGGWIDAGFSGSITLEMCNATSGRSGCTPGCRSASSSSTRPNVHCVPTT